MSVDTPLLRIGELSRRTGVSSELLRAWEKRYGLLNPSRSTGGLRLYSSDDLERVRRMQRHLASGMAAAEAAAMVTREEPGAAAPAVSEAQSTRAELRAALDSLDEQTMQNLLDRHLATSTIDALVSDVIMPLLGEVGDRWARGEISVAHEHFASNVLRGRLLGLARGWGRGFGPLALLACLPGEQHDLGLICFGLALRARGWNITYLGSDTPLDTVEQAMRLLSPSVVALSGVTPVRIGPIERELNRLASRTRLVIGGGAALAIELEGSRVIALNGDPVAEAERLTEIVARQAGTNPS